MLTPVISALGKQRQKRCEFKAIVGYVVSANQLGLQSEDLSQTATIKTNEKKKRIRKDRNNSV